MRVFTTAAALLAMCVGAISAQPVRVAKDIDYVASTAYADGKDLLDIYAPERAKNAPVLLVFHGGGLTQGDRSGHGHAGQRFARAGFVTVVASYRLSPGVSHPAHIQDAAAAFAWTHANIRTRGGDPARIFVVGHSAGAYLAALLATDPRYLAAHQLTPKHIRGVVPVAGFFWVDREGVAPDRPKEIWGADPRGWIDASPAKYFGAHVPPTLLIIGDRDAPWRLRQNDEAASAVGAAGQRDVTHLVLKGRDHGQIWAGLNQGDADDVALAIVRFVQRLSRNTATE